MTQGSDASMPGRRPWLFLLCGPSGAGKSTLARQILDRLKAVPPIGPTAPAPVLLSSDAIVESFAREEGVPYAEAYLRHGPLAEAMVLAGARHAAERGADVVFDRTNLTVARRAVVAGIFPDHLRAVVRVTADPETLLARLAARQATTGKEIPEAVLRAQLASFELPDLHEIPGLPWERNLAPEGALFVAAALSPLA